jgi:hypothetical protein
MYREFVLFILLTLWSILGFNFFQVAPIAVEPCEDGVAGIGTVLVQLPGGDSAPCKLGLGSALLLLSGTCAGNGDDTPAPVAAFSEPVVTRESARSSFGSSAVAFLRRRTMFLRRGVVVRGGRRRHAHQVPAVVGGDVSDAATASPSATPNAASRLLNVP